MRARPQRRDKAGRKVTGTARPQTRERIRRRRGGKKSPERIPFFERHERAVAASLVSLVVVAVAWASVSRLAEALFGTRARAPAVEHLLETIDEDNARRGLTLEWLALQSPATRGSEEVRRAIRDAARSVRIDERYLIRVAAKESAFDPLARAQRTTATGLYQFTEDTWLRAVKVFGGKHGLSDYARQITIREGGEISISNAGDRPKLLQLRSDPRLSALMAAELGRDNKARLEQMLGRAVTPAETYIAHFLGVRRAARMIGVAHSAPHTTGARLFPDAAITNPHVFSPAGQAASVGAILSKIDDDFGGEALPRRPGPSRLEESE